MYKLDGDMFATIPGLIQHHLKFSVPVQASNNILLKTPVKNPFSRKDNSLYKWDDVKLTSRLGGGNFGDVFQGVIKSDKISVAVKTCKENQRENLKKKFLEEAEIMKPCQHPNVVKLIGICRDKEPYYICKYLDVFFSIDH